MWVASRLLRCQPRAGSCRTSSTSSSRPTTAAASAAAALPFSAIPGPSVVPVLRSLPHLLPGGRYFNMPPLQQLEQWRRDFGPLWRLELPLQKPALFMTRPEDAREVFLADGKLPKREDFEAFAAYRKSRGLGCGIVAAEGDQWKEYREMGQHVLGGPQAAMKYVSKIAEAADMFIDHLRRVRSDAGTASSSGTDTPPDTVAGFQEAAKLWSFESMNMMALGAPVGIYERDVEAARLFNATMDLFQCFTELTHSLPLWRFFPTGSYRRLGRATDTVFDTCSEYVRRALAAPVAGSMLELVTDQVRSERQRRMVTDVIVDLLVSSIDTTSTTLTYLLHCLAVHPESQARAREEVLALLPLPDSEITPHVVSQMTYLKACLKEALRLHHVAAGVGRVLGRPVQLSGYAVPAGVRCIVLSQAMSRDANYFPEPERFLPDRWIRSSPHYSKPPQFACLPFGHGPRMCIGRRFAELETWVTAALLLRRFQIGTSTPQFGQVMKLINVPDRPIDIQLTDL